MDYLEVLNGLIDGPKTPNTANKICKIFHAELVHKFINAFIIIFLFIVTDCWPQGL